MGQEDRVYWKHFSQAIEAIKYAKSEGYSVIAVEICQDAKPYQNYNYSNKVCLSWAMKIQVFIRKFCQYVMMLSLFRTSERTILLMLPFRRPL